MPAKSLIVDLEATCCNDDSFPSHEMEIIEIGAVAVDAVTGEPESEFQAFVRPVRHPRLTDFCTTLTGITQADVDAADPFPVVIAAFRSWLADVTDYDFCSWGDYDRVQFEQDCRYHRVPYPFAGPHRNLKREFSAMLGTTKRFGMKGALEKLGLPLTGSHHRGIDDARNIARIHQEMLRRAKGPS